MSINTISNYYNIDSKERIVYLELAEVFQHSSILMPIDKTILKNSILELNKEKCNLQLICSMISVLMKIINTDSTQYYTYLKTKQKYYQKLLYS